MRISGICFAQIKVGAQFVLLLNGGQLRYNNRRILSPVGGGLIVTEPGYSHLITNFGARDFESAPDLRFCVDDKQVRAVASWFGRRLDREVGVWREMREELTVEAGALNDADLIGARETVLDGYRQYRAVTDRQVAERKSLYLIEVSKVDLSDDALAKLRRAATLPIAERWVYLVTPQEIAARKTHDGVAIGPISRFVL